MDRRVGGAGAVVLVCLAVGVWRWGVPEGGLEDPWWWLIVAAALAYWVGMVLWTGGSDD
jgi:hypothetical protein